MLVDLIATHQKRWGRSADAVEEYPLGAIARIKAKGSRIWVNALWASLNGGHDDDVAETNLPDSYDWPRGQPYPDRPASAVSKLPERQGLTSLTRPEEDNNRITYPAGGGGALAGQGSKPLLQKH